MRSRPVYLAVICLLSSCPLSWAQTPTLQAIGLTLQTLSADDLDAIRRATGYRVGVLVTDVKPGSAAEKAGLKPDGVIMTIGSSGPDSVESAEKAFAAATGSVELVVVRVSASGESEVAKVTLEMPTGAPAEGGSQPPSSGAQTAAPVTDAQAKLKALEAARDAGVLTDEEFARKKQELLSPGGGAAPAAAGGQTAEYKDPQDRFSFRHPRSWTVAAFPNGEGVSLLSGGSSISLMLVSGQATPTALTDSLTKQLSGQFSGYKQLARADAKWAGVAQMVEFTGANPKGVASHCRLVATVTAAGQGYALLLSAPTEAFTAGDAVLSAVVTSFAFGGAPLGDQAGKTYRHPIGFSFWYPSDWSVKEGDSFLVLTPPGMAAGPNQTEVYLVIRESVADTGVQGSDDPTVASFLDQAVVQLSPALQRSGPGVAVPMNSAKGTLYEWSAPATAGGKVIARAYATILKEHGVALVAIGLDGKLAAREPLVRRIFASFGLAEGARDPQAAGAWHLLESRYLANDLGERTGYVNSYEKARAATDVNSTLALNPDGSATRTDSSRTIAGGAGIWIDSGDQRTVKQGKWNASEGTLCLLWENGALVTYRYVVEDAAEGRRLKLTVGNSVETWSQ
jgi:hypothetical protein